MLTAKQRDLLMLIHERLQESGVSPSFEEMKETLGLRSKSGIHRLIRALEERGFLRRLPHRARALEVLRLPDTSTIATVRKGQDFVPQLISMNDVAEGEGSALVEIPVMGRIAAGTPIEALQNPERTMFFPESLLASGDHYALDVEGDSMVGAGILDGDMALIRKTETAMNGDIVVALIDDREATLKRLRRKGDVIALEAANPAYEPRIVPPERIQVQGKMAGLFRKY